MPYADPQTIGVLSVASATSLSNIVSGTSSQSNTVSNTVDSATSRTMGVIDSGTSQTNTVSGTDSSATPALNSNMITVLLGQMYNEYYNIPNNTYIHTYYPNGIFKNGVYHIDVIQDFFKKVTNSKRNHYICILPNTEVTFVSIDGKNSSITTTYDEVIVASTNIKTISVKSNSEDSGIIFRRSLEDYARNAKIPPGLTTARSIRFNEKMDSSIFILRNNEIVYKDDDVERIIKNNYNSHNILVRIDVSNRKPFTLSKPKPEMFTVDYHGVTFSFFDLLVLFFLCLIIYYMYTKTN
jgi:hypothetical protein